MTLAELKTALTENSEKRLAFQLPDGKVVPLHFHITELGLVSKDFVDCGGTRRSTRSCALQIWVANDTEHVLFANRLNEILSHSDTLGLDGSDEVECEYTTEHFSIFQILSHQVNEKAIVFQLSNKQTACLSPDKCGLDEFGNPTSCC